MKEINLFQNFNGYTVKLRWSDEKRKRNIYG